MTEYLDFELEIGSGAGRLYPVTVLRSPAGECRGTMRFPFDELELENRLQAIQIAILRSGGAPRRRVLAPEDQAVQEFGEALFSSLFSDDVRAAYDLSRRETLLHGKGLRIKLRIQAPELASLPWEFLYDPSQAQYISLSRFTPIVRYLDVPGSIDPVDVIPPLRMLGMVTSPSDLPPLNVERERKRVEEALKGLRSDGLLELEWVPGQSWRDLQKAMRRETWHIFHFVGHGRFDARMDEGIVALTGDYGQTAELTATQLGHMLADHPSLQLAVLNACEGAVGSSKDIFSGTAAILVRRGIPAVLAMQYEISDRAAIELARSFYESIADGSPVDAAVTEARKAISIALPNTSEWGTPVLYMRSSEGVLFRVQSPARRRAAAPVATAATSEVLAPDEAEGATRLERKRKGRTRLILTGAIAAALAIVAGLLVVILPGSTGTGAVNPACTLLADPTGDDSATGTPQAPLRSVDTLVNKLKSGDTGCLRGKFLVQDLIIAKSDITLRSATGDLAELDGGPIVIAADGVTVRELKIVGHNSVSGNGALVKVSGASRVAILRNDITNGQTSGVCLYVDTNNELIPDGTVIAGNLIHDCGLTSRIGDGPGISIGRATNTQIVNNLIYDNSGWGIKLFDGTEGTGITDTAVKYNTIVWNTYGILIGGEHQATVANNSVAFNVISNSTTGYDLGSRLKDAVRSDNTVDSNCFGPHAGTYDIDPLPRDSLRVTNSNIRNVVPTYVNAHAKDFRLEGPPACLKWGVQSAGERVFGSTLNGAVVTPLRPESARPSPE